MDINSMLKGCVCTCGKEHKCDIEHIYVENGAIKHLAELCKEFEKILIVADENTYSAAGAQTIAALSGKNIHSVITYCYSYLKKTTLIRMLSFFIYKSSFKSPSFIQPIFLSR